MKFYDPNKGWTELVSEDRNRKPEGWNSPVDESPRVKQIEKSLFKVLGNKIEEVWEGKNGHIEIRMNSDMPLIVTLDKIKSWNDNLRQGGIEIVGFAVNHGQAYLIANV